MAHVKKILPAIAKAQLSSLAIALVLIIGLAFLGSYLINSSDAARRSTLPIGLYLGSTSSRISPDSILSVTVYENSGSDPVNAVQAKLTYDPQLVQYYGISEGVTFPVIAATDVTVPGVIQIARGIAADSPGVTGSNVVATVDFKVLPTATGNVVLNFDSQNSFLVRTSDNTNILSGVVGGTYKISTRR